MVRSSPYRYGAPVGFGGRFAVAGFRDARSAWCDLGDHRRRARRRVGGARERGVALVRRGACRLSVRDAVRDLRSDVPVCGVVASPADRSAAPAGLAGVASPRLACRKRPNDSGVSWARTSSRRRSSVVGRGRVGLRTCFVFWGCIPAAAVTFPLVFGWLHFESVGQNARGIGRTWRTGAR